MFEASSGEHLIGLGTLNWMGFMIKSIL